MMENVSFKSSKAINIQSFGHPISMEKLNQIYTRLKDIGFCSRGNSYWQIGELILERNETRKKKFTHTHSV